MKHKFKVGDAVVGNTKAFPHRRGQTGVVSEIRTNGGYFVTWGPDKGMHWAGEEELEPVENPKPKPFDAVSKPSHYNHGDGIECIDYIRQVLGKDGFIAYCRGNQIKYQHRAMYKGKPVEDLEKAHQYNAWTIEALKE